MQGMPDLNVPDAGDPDVLGFVDKYLVPSNQTNRWAEFGVYKGATTRELAKRCKRLDVFDFDERLRDLDLPDNCVKYGNSRKYLDSYAWTLSKFMDPPERLWQFVYLDGPHTWAVDAFTLLLIERLILPYGFIVLDDLSWTIDKSPAMMSDKSTMDMYTQEQRLTPQIDMICKLLLDNNERWAKLQSPWEYKAIYMRRAL